MIKHMTLGISLSLLLLLPVRAQESDSMKEEQQIRFIINEIAKGWEKGDTVVFRKYYTHDSTARMIETGDQNVGVEDLIQHHVLVERGYFEERGSLINAVEIHLARDFKSAWSISDFEFWATTKDGEHFHTKGFETMIWEKKNDGWKIIHSHYSAGKVHIKK